MCALVLVLVPVAHARVRLSDRDYSSQHFYV